MAGVKKGKVGGRAKSSEVVKRKCVDCGKVGAIQTEIISVKRCSSTGRGRMVFLCKPGQGCN